MIEPANSQQQLATGQHGSNREAASSRTGLEETPGTSNGSGPLAGTTSRSSASEHPHTELRMLAALSIAEEGASLLASSKK
jgi:hypothetical protein